MRKIQLLLIALLAWLLVGCTIQPPLPPPPEKMRVVCTEQPVCKADRYGQVICHPRCSRVN